MSSDEGRAKPPHARRAAEILCWLERPPTGHRGRLLGSGYQATVELHATPYGNVVVKRARRGLATHWLGRLAIRHEYRAYQRLAGVTGIPRAYGMLQDDALVLEHVPGPSLRAGEQALVERERFFAAFLETLHAMHAAGVAHGDLKRKDNILVGPDEHPFLIDFGISCLLGAGGNGWNARLFRWVRQSDYNAWTKLKYRRRLDELSQEDGALYQPLLLERVARAIRVPYQKLTLRRLRQRLKKRNRSRGGA